MSVFAIFYLKTKISGITTKCITEQLKKKQKNKYSSSINYIKYKFTTLHVCETNRVKLYVISQ